MQIYSTATDKMFMARVVQMARRVDAAATAEIISGPTSLQKRSILRILAFKTAHRNNNHRVSTNVILPNLFILFFFFFSSCFVLGGTN